MTFRRTAALCLILATLTACMPVPPRAVGDWNGIMSTPQGEFPVVIHIRSAGPDTGNKLESPAQAPGDMTPITITTASDDRLDCDVPSLKASYRSSWNAPTSSWRGDWKQSGYRFPLTLWEGPGTAAVQGLDGTWQAKVTRPNGTFRLILRIETRANSTSIRFDAPDAGVSDLAVSPFQRKGNRIIFGVPSTGARFEGTLSDGSGAMTGNWTFPQQPQTSVTFARTAGAANGAPSPATYRSAGLSIANPQSPDVTLACTITTPDMPPPFPTVVFATGSGAQDRDETMYGHKPFAVIANELTRQGFATLRCDDRGIGQSTGTFETATTLDFASDATAQVNALLSRPDTRPDAIYLLGHSEGALVSVITAGQDPRVAGLVLLGAPASNLRQMLLAQHRMIGETQGQGAVWLTRTQPVLEQVFDAVTGASSQPDAETRLRGVLTPKARDILHLSPSDAELFIRQMASPWMRTFLRLDTRALLAKVRVPVLALAGSLDRQVEPASNLDALRKGLTGSADVTVQQLEGLNHFLQKATTGAPAEYASIPETINPAAMEAITQWLKRHAGK
jgi:hypothetical protein